MGTVTVSVELDYLETLVKKPRLGIAELIWNALDADAQNIRCTVEVNTMDVIDQVSIADDGTGITPETAERSFGHLGGSWKKTATATDGGRTLHGREGKGRWAAYGVGDAVRWDSVADRVTGDRERTVISGHRSSLKQFDIGEPETVDSTTPTGTTVTITTISETSSRSLEKDDVRSHLTAVFALWLEKYPVSISWRSQELNVEEFQTRRSVIPLDLQGVADVELVVIEWSVPQPRALHLCDSSGTSLLEMKAGIQAPGFDFTAYIKWDGFKALGSDLVLTESDEQVSSLIAAAQDQLRRYFHKRSEEKSSELVAEWKSENTYPYTGTPSNPVEAAERELFDIVALAISPAVRDADTRGRKLSLRLLREAIENRPTALREILYEIVELPEEQLLELYSLLGRTSLTSVITAAKEITDRLDFVAGLEKLLFDPTSKKELLERSQLQHILADQTWIFAEEYALTGNDESLHSVLVKHIGLMGRDGLVSTDLDADVLDHEGKRVIPDLLLSRATEEPHNRREHLVVELKRPSVKIGPKELEQIQKYALAIANDERFRSVDVTWDLWIVSNQMNDFARSTANQKGRDPGVVYEDSDRPITIRAFEWATLLENVKHRLKFVQKALSYTSTSDSSLEYLRKTHEKYLPPSFSTEPSPTPEPEGAPSSV